MVALDYLTVGAPVWLGTDNELESWGVYQYSRVKKNNPPEVNKDLPKEKPVEEKVINPIEETPAEDLLEF